MEATVDNKIRYSDRPLTECAVTFFMFIIETKPINPAKSGAFLLVLAVQ